MGHDHGELTEHGAWPAPARIAVVLLAAGASSRMGTVKGLLPLRSPWGEPEGEPAVSRIVRVSQDAGLGSIVVVLGHHAEVMEPVVTQSARAGVVLARNPRPEEGMFSSVKAGLAVALSGPRAPEAVMVWPVDVPLVSAESVRALLEAGTLEVASSKPYWVRALAWGHEAHQTGHPVLLSGELARRVCAADSGERLDHLLSQPDVLWQRVLVRDRFVGMDLDTMADAWPWIVPESGLKPG